jgi:hypothetical protein
MSVTMWCYHGRTIEVYSKTKYISALRHTDDKTPCIGRNPKRG